MTVAQDVVQKEEMKDVIDDFVVESGELIDAVIRDIVVVEKNPDEDIINGIFRAVHTIKGTSSFLGFNVLSNLSHKAEDVLARIRKKEIAATAEAADALLEALDLMKLMVDDIRTKGAEDRDPLQTMGNLERLFNMEKTDQKKIGDILVEERVLTEEERDRALEKQSTNRDKRFGEILVEEKLITEGQLKSALTKQRTHAEDQTIRIDVKKLDELMDLVGELVLGKNRLILLGGLVKKNASSNGVLDNLRDVTNYIEAITNELQLSVMKARLVPIGRLFGKVPRLVRDLCTEFQKDIGLKVEGEDTELDRSLIEALHDPLIHIIRNSVDHGVELPTERQKKGKDGRGMLYLRAYNEGNHIIIEVFDDGRGINLEAVKDKVKERGLMGEDELKVLTPKEVMGLIFIPGLSTATTLSKVSGRGVGMDVVKTNIEKVNGQVLIDSEEGKWTRLTIKFPLSLAIMRALIVKTGDELFAIPLNIVTELVRIREGLIESVDKNEVIVLRDMVIPLVDLSTMLLATDGNSDQGYIVICDLSEKTVGVKTSSVIGQEEVVIKPLGDFLGAVAGIAGATIRGDGNVVLILDLPALIERLSNQQKKQQVAEPISTEK
jgi:two-component system, chemotaxis family, sensor kinase CheA